MKLIIKTSTNIVEDINHSEFTEEVVKRLEDTYDSQHVQRMVIDFKEEVPLMDGRDFDGLTDEHIEKLTVILR